MIRTRHDRRGATLVELLVASALCVGAMYLMTWMFQQAVDGSRGARSQTELTAQHRMVTTILKRDLLAHHFLDEDGKPNNGRRLSDQRTDLVTSGGYTPPRGGFFHAQSRPVDGVFNFDEPISDGFGSSRSSDHYLHFTVLLPGGANFNQFSAEVPAGSGAQYYGTAAEVIYYLRESGQTPGGVKLYDLYRQQRLAARTADDAPAYRVPASYLDAPEVMVVSNGTMRTLADLTVPVGFTDPTVPAGFPSYCRLRPFEPIGTNGATSRLSDDLLVSGVVSFEVKFTGPQANLGAGAWPTDPASTTWPRQELANTDYPYDNLPFDARFDTFSSRVTNWQTQVASPSNPSGPIKPIRITGAQIRLRSYETGTQQTRQTTLIVDL